MSVDLKISEFNTCYAHYTSAELSDEDFNSNWTLRFFAISNANLFALLSLANQLGNELLLNTVARRVAAIIEGLGDPVLIREHFDLPDVLTPKQKETVRKEYGQVLD